MSQCFLASSFRDFTDLRQHGCDWMADLVQAAGCPTEIIFVFLDRMMCIHAFDYMEGEVKPLVQRSHWWWDAIEPSDMKPPRGTTGTLVIGPEAVVHTLPSRETR